MNILITGPLSDIGRVLIPQLLQRGHALRILAPKPPQLSLPRGANYDLCIGTAFDSQTVHGCLLGVDTVVHLEDVLFAASPEKTMRVADYDTTINIAYEAVKQGVARFVFPSVPQVLGPSEIALPPLSPEDAVMPPNNFFALYKKLCEQHLLILQQQQKIDVTILRYGMIYGPYTRMQGMCVNLLRQSRMLLPRQTESFIPFIHVRDAASLMLTAIERSNARRKTYHVADELPVSFKEYVFALAEAYETPMPRLISDRSFKPLSAFFSRWDRLFGKRYSFNTDLISLIGSPCMVRTDSVKNELSFYPYFTSIYEGLGLPRPISTARRRWVAA